MPKREPATAPEQALSERLDREIARLLGWTPPNESIAHPAPSGDEDDGHEQSTGPQPTGGPYPDRLGASWARPSGRHGKW